MGPSPSDLNHFFAIDLARHNWHIAADHHKYTNGSGVGGLPMLRSVLLLGCFGLGLSLSIAADTRPVDDLTALQGNWKPLQCEFQGKSQMTAEEMKQMTGVYEKADYYLYFVDTDKNGKPDVMQIAHANITLDPTTSPKGILFELAEGRMKGAKQHGIYEIAGNQLKLCYGPIDKPKPTEFKSTPGSGYFLETWARQQK
jgi:uncharacterized protein (TIGR03067 family)